MTYDRYVTADLLILTEGIGRILRRIPDDSEPMARTLLQVATEMVADAIESLELADPAEKAQWDATTLQRVTDAVDAAFGTLTVAPGQVTA